MKSLYIKDLEKNQVFTGETFAVFEMEKAEDKNGKPYYKLVLGDKTGRLPAKIWSDKFAMIDTKTVKVGKVVMMSAKVEEYQGKFQLNIMELSGVDEVKMEEFIESSEFDAEEMYSELLSEINSITKSDLKTVVLKIVSETDIKRKLKYWPAAVSVHHDFRSGLLQHILEMIEISKGMKRFYANADFDVLKAGIVMHDLGKLFELEINGLTTSYSVEGTLLGHISKGLLIWQKYAEGNVSSVDYLHIQHLILSHHGSLEFGSPVLPSTLEAIMLTQIDNLSAKSRIVTKAKKSIANNQKFSFNIPWLGNVKIWSGNAKDTKETKDEAQDDLFSL